MKEEEDPDDIGRQRSSTLYTWKSTGAHRSMIQPRKLNARLTTLRASFLGAILWGVYEIDYMLHDFQGACAHVYNPHAITC